MHFSFPYTFIKIDSVIIPYSTVKVVLPTIMGKVPYDLIVDSGADMLTLPKYFKCLLSLDRKKLRNSSCRGAGKYAIKTTEAQIEIGFCGKNFHVPISITDNNETPLLLGKIGIWDKYNIFFNNKKKRIEFEEIK